MKKEKYVATDTPIVYNEDLTYQYIQLCTFNGLYRAALCGDEVVELSTHWNGRFDCVPVKLVCGTTRLHKHRFVITKVAGSAPEKHYEHDFSRGFFIKRLTKNNQHLAKA